MGVRCQPNFREQIGQALQVRQQAQYRFDAVDNARVIDKDGAGYVGLGIGLRLAQIHNQ